MQNVRLRVRAALLVAGALLCATDRAAGQTDSAVFASWESQLDRLRGAHKLPGLAAAIVDGGQLVWSKGYGYADADREVPVTPDTPFWIASVSKTFLGLLFLRLEQEGSVKLDDRINDVPDWSDFCDWFSKSGIAFGRTMRCSAPITVRNILNHTANGTPGTSFLYNPIMYSRLSRYIEHKFGRSVDDVEGEHNTLAQLVESHILEPAGMRRTMASMWQREKALVYFDMARGFGVDKTGRWIKRPMPDRELSGGAGIVSTVEDLARYVMAIDRGRLGNKALIEKLFQPALAPNGKVLPYAFGWYVQQYRGETLQWHSGWDEEAGYSALLLRVPGRRMALILLANGEGLWWGNPPDAAAVERSPFAAAFLERFVFAR